MLLENATHLVQPLDVRIFSPLKAEMDKRKQLWRDANPGKTINKYELIRIILPALEKTLGNKSLIKEGFRASGLYVEGKGFDPSQVDFSRMKASEVFAEGEDLDDDGVTAALPSTVTGATDSLLPITAIESTSLTIQDPVYETDLLSTFSSGLADDSLLVPVTIGPTVPVTRFPDVHETSHNTALFSAVSRDATLALTRVPAVPMTSGHTANLSRDHIISDTMAPGVTEPGELTAPIISLFRDHTLPVTSDPAVAVTGEVSGPISGVTSAPDTDCDNPLTQFKIPLEDRKRRLVINKIVKP